MGGLGTRAGKDDDGGTAGIGFWAKAKEEGGSVTTKVCSKYEPA